MKICEPCSLQRTFQVEVYERCNAHIHAIHTCLGKKMCYYLNCHWWCESRQFYLEKVLSDSPALGTLCLRTAVLSLGCVGCESHMLQPLLKAFISEIQMLIFNLPFLWRLFTSLSKRTAEQDCCSIQSLSVGSRGRSAEPGGRSGGWPPSLWWGIGTGGA